MQVVSIDLGFGFLKANGPRGAVTAPAVTGPARPLFPPPPDADPLDYLTHREEGADTFVGSLAVRQAATRLHTLRPERATAPGARVLYRTGLALVANDGLAAAVTGLPVTWYWLQRDDMQKLAQGRHEIALQAGAESITRTVTAEHVTIVPQPLGTAADYVLDDDGQLARAEAGGSIGVIDIGFHTCDLLLLKGMEIDRNGSQSTRSGMHVALRALSDAGADSPLYVLDADAREGRYRDAWRQACMALAQQITAEAETYWQQWPSVVLLSGGGAAALAEYLALPRAQLVPDPQGANVRGYRKLGRQIYGSDYISPTASAGRRLDTGIGGDRTGRPERTGAARFEDDTRSALVAGVRAAGPTGAGNRRR